MSSLRTKLDRLYKDGQISKMKRDELQDRLPRDFRRVATEIELLPTTVYGDFSGILLEKIFRSSIEYTHGETDIGGNPIAGDIIQCTTGKVVGHWGPGTRESYIEVPINDLVSAIKAKIDGLRGEELLNVAIYLGVDF